MISVELILTSTISKFLTLPHYRYMIDQKQTDKIVATNNLYDADKLLGGTMVKKMTLNSQGISTNQIVITYNERNEKAESQSAS